MLIACAASTSSMAAQRLAPDTLSKTERAQSITPKKKGSVVLRAQVLLDRAHFSPGEIDAAYGLNLRNAISGYQKANGLLATGIVDAGCLEAAIAMEDRNQVLCTHTQDFTEGIAAFLEKRSPHYSNS